MKYGLLINREARNLGDDIQSYAESLFLPRIDYLVDREHISKFRPESPDEAVAVIMGAWWTKHKWNFPPPKNVIPLLTSIHIMGYTPQQQGSPIFDEFLEGVGGDFFKAYGPVGTRDYWTLDVLKNLNIPSYFSGCVTLTLPKQEKIHSEKEYVLIVDLEPRVEAKVRKMVPKGIEIKKISNTRISRRTPEQMDDWEFRKNETIELLRLYQNAKCVVTRRLHVSLPCLAMEVPVLCIHNPNDNRFDPYKDWLHMVSPRDFLSDKYSYDFSAPRPNKTLHIETAQALKKQMSDFVDKTSKETRPLNDLILTKYTPEEVAEWRNSLMQETLDKWLPQSVNMARKIVSLETKLNKYKRKIEAITGKSFQNLSEIKVPFHIRVKRKLKKLISSFSKSK